jgi:hypothetical protein
MWRRALIFGAALTIPSAVYCFAPRDFGPLLNAIVTAFMFAGLIVAVVLVPVHGGGSDWLRCLAMASVNFGVWTLLAYGLLQFRRPASKW